MPLVDGALSLSVSHLALSGPLRHEPRPMSKSAVKIAPPDMDTLARIGAKVRARLEADEAVFQFPTEAAELYAVANFFTPAECARLRGLIDATAEPSKLFDNPYESGFRTSYSGNLS